MERVRLKRGVEMINEKKVNIVQVTVVLKRWENVMGWSVSEVSSINEEEGEHTEAKDVTRNVDRLSMTLRNINVHANPIWEGVRKTNRPFRY